MRRAKPHAPARAEIISPNATAEIHLSGALSDAVIEGLEPTTFLTLRLAFQIGKRSTKAPPDLSKVPDDVLAKATALLREERQNFWEAQSNEIWERIRTTLTSEADKLYAALGPDDTRSANLTLVWGVHSPVWSKVINQ